MDNLMDILLLGKADACSNEKQEEIYEMLAKNGIGESLEQLACEEEKRYVLCVYNKKTQQLDGLMTIDLTDQQNFAITNLCANHQAAVVVMIDKVEKLANGKMKKNCITASVSAADESARKILETFTYMYENVDGKKYAMRRYAKDSYNSLAIILSWFDKKLESGRMFDYFAKYYQISEKNFIKYLERETGENVSRFTKSPRFYGALMLCQELNRAGIAFKEFVEVMKNKKSEPEKYASLVGACPNTFEKFESYIWDIYKIIDALSLYQGHLEAVAQLGAGNNAME